MELSHIYLAVPVQQGINPYLPTVLLSIPFNKLPLIADGHEIDPDHQGDTHSQPLLPSSSQSDRLDEDISSDDDAGANNAGYMRRKTKNHRSSAGKGMGFFQFYNHQAIKGQKISKKQVMPCSHILQKKYIEIVLRQIVAKYTLSKNE